MVIENLQEFLLQPTPQLLRQYSITVKDNAATPAQFRALANAVNSLSLLCIVSDQLTELPDLKDFKGLNRLVIYSTKNFRISRINLPPGLKNMVIDASQNLMIEDDVWQNQGLETVRLKGSGVTSLWLPAEIKVRSLWVENTNLAAFKIGGPQSTLLHLSIAGQGLKHLGEDLKNLKSVTSITLNVPLETAAVTFDPEVHLSSLRIQYRMPDDASFLKTLPAVSLLHITGSGSVWSGLPDIHQWKSLKDLTLRGCQDTELSQEKITGKELTRISLQNCQLHFRPEMFQQSSELKWVSLSGTPAVNILACLKCIPQVEVWNFHDLNLENFEQLSDETTSAANSFYLSDIKNSLTNFDFLDAFPKLKYLRIQGKHLIPYAAFLRDKPVPLDQIKNFLPDFKYKNAKQFCSLASAIFKSGLPREDQECLVNLIAKQTALQIPKSWDLSFLLKATNISYASFKKKLWSVLEEKSEQALTTKPLNKDTVLYLSGKSKLKVKEINTFCEALGIQLVKKYNDQVTHVLIGVKSTDYDLLKNKKITLVTATALAQTYKLSQPQFLKDQEVTEDGSVPAALENLDQLLSTDDTPTLMMALEMIKQGGLPKNSIGTLMVKHKTTKDAKVRKVSKALLELYADADWRPLLADRGSFKNIYNPGKREIDTRRQLKDLAKRTSPTLVGNFSCLLFEKTGKGLRYALTAGLKKDLKKKAYGLLLKDQSFDFSRGLGYSERGNKKNMYEDYYVMPESSVALPILALELDTIHSLNLTNCRYNSLSDKIVKFKDLKELVLAINELKHLPEVLTELTELETIDLRDNLFTRFPAVLEKLPNLKKIDLRKNEGVVVPDSFVRSHPNCTVLLGE